MHISPYFVMPPEPLTPDQIPRSGVHVIKWMPDCEPAMRDGEYKILAHRYNPHRWLVAVYSRTLKRTMEGAEWMRAEAFRSVVPSGQKIDSQ